MKTVGAPISWAMGVALAALARHADADGRFDEANLAGWMGDLIGCAPSHAPTNAATLALRQWRYASPTDRRHSNGAVRNRSWQLTAAGAEAAQAAYAALCQGAPDASALATRLWNLLRIRRRLTTDEAASMLVDAGDTALYARQKKAIGALLRAWAKHAPDVVTVAARREAGHLRYVLLRDLGAWPPPARAGQRHPSEFPIQVPEKFKRQPAEQPAQQPAEGQP